MFRSLVMGAAVAVSALSGSAASATSLLTNPDFTPGFADVVANITPPTPGQGLSYDSASLFFEFLDLSSITLAAVDTNEADPAQLAVNEADPNGVNQPPAISLVNRTIANAEVRASAFVNGDATLGPAGTLHDGSTGAGVLTITGEFSYDTTFNGALDEELFSGLKGTTGNPVVDYETPLVRATLIEIGTPGNGAGGGDDVRFLWRVDETKSVAGALFGHFVVSQFNAAGLSGPNPFNDSFNVNSFITSDHRYARVPVPAALPLFAAALGAFGVMRARRKAAA